MATFIHPSAAVDPAAKIGADVHIGPFVAIEADVEIGDGCMLGAHTVIHSGVKLGKRNKVSSHAAIGGDPQDLKYAGQKTRLEIGDDNMIREFVTLNRGTEEGGGLTVIGSHNLFMTCSHVAHDCHIGNHIVIVNNVAVAGHCLIEDRAVVGGLTGLHQFARIGELAMAGALGRFSKDLLPYCTTAGGDEVKVYGLNKIGLKRSGMSKEDLEALDRAMHIYLKPSLSYSEALQAIEEIPQKTREIQHLIDFVKASKRGVYR